MHMGLCLLTVPGQDGTPAPGIDYILSHFGIHFIGVQIIQIIVWSYITYIIKLHLMYFIISHAFSWMMYISILHT